MSTTYFVYGTSGFRAEATKLDKVVRRTAFYAAERAKFLGKAIGLMITASHNPAVDNGIKLIDSTGKMLPILCEEKLTKIVNVTDEEFREYMGKNVNNSNANSNDKGNPMVIIGTDTRPSSPKLLQEAIDGVHMFGNGVAVKTFESHTTPQLHFIVRSFNNSGSPEDAYILVFRKAFVESFNIIPHLDKSHYSNQLYVDCANGVGALWVRKYLAELEISEEFVPLELTLLNTQTDKGELLNFECGADFVKIHAKAPVNFNQISNYSRCASLDGDADRLVYFYRDGDEQLRVLDGDHISALFAKFIKKQLDEAKEIGYPINLKFGIVQTAYANGNSTQYFTKELGITPILAKTGVKYLEEEAQKFDIGLYFEANGHGTVCFSDNFHQIIKDCFEVVSKGLEVPLHIQMLALFSKLVNEVVGDGIADLLAVECLLRYFDWSIQDWERQTYKNMPNVQLKVPVQDRSIYSTAENNETKLVRPEGMQTEIDKIVEKFTGSRAFIRPSGTEQIVRVYAEAMTEEGVKALANRLAKLIN